MELSQARYVIAIAETSNFTRAAERCFVAQSALSHQVAKLESELGVRLFARTSRRVQLTAAGAAFLPWARQCVAAADRAMVDAAGASGVIRGTLTIGLIPTLAAIDLPDTLGRFHRDHPSVDVSLQVGASDHHVGEIRAGRMDVAFLGLPSEEKPRGVACTDLGEDSLVAVVHPAHQLAKADQVRLESVVDETFVDFPYGTPGRAQSERAFASRNLRRHVTFESTGADLIAEIVRTGLAMTLVASRHARRLPGLVAVPIDDAPRRREFMAWSEFNPSPATAAFVALVDSGEAGPHRHLGS